MKTKSTLAELQPIDTQQFTAGMRRLASAVCIIATRSEGKRWGLTATAVCSLSAKPPRLLACINCSGRTLSMISESRIMSVNVLEFNEVELAKRFAGLSPNKCEDPFDNDDWHEMSTGAPVLRAAMAAFDCVVDEMLFTHSHAIVIGEIKDIYLGPGTASLVYAERSFTTIKGPETSLRDDWMDYPWL